MNKTKSIVAVIMIMLVTLIGFTACHNKSCKKDKSRCERKCCSKKDKCCDKCSDKCSADNKCCDKCQAGEKKACCSKDSLMTEEKACCSKDAKTDAAMYACPMHKDITSEKPGKCSECGMDLENTK